ncbi:hypothetical protein TGDOM2_364350 [Toxoplasma gondii GAB2-2007-GAL-DOM2]|uniref:Uncharacterized protein n=1 Tax=Toxoplasma gondii GAB2-2007-GAL-DOM2 TaxID=1130820 RepID=A0A086K9Y9_TOXGO|nr:hypothetical protein TGDOM2_364350 [Toxoplasma gondii GAB2-2007-GAL-DOM2]
MLSTHLRPPSPLTNPHCRNLHPTTTIITTTIIITHIPLNPTPTAPLTAPPKKATTVRLVLPTTPALHTILTLHTTRTLLVRPAPPKNTASLLRTTAHTTLTRQ